MIEVTLTRVEFNEFVFPDVSGQAVAPDMVRTALSLIRKLSDPEVTERQGETRWPSRHLVASRHTFQFTLEEAKLLVVLLEKAVVRHPILVLPDFVALVERVGNAVKEAETKVESSDPDEG